LAQYASAIHAVRDIEMLSGWRCSWPLQIRSFLTGYPDALERAKAFDSQVKRDASAISSSYVGLVELSIRQAFGAIEFTVSKNDHGYNADDVLVFMKGTWCLRAFSTGLI